MRFTFVLQHFQP